MEETIALGNGLEREHRFFGASEAPEIETKSLPGLFLRPSYSSIGENTPKIQADKSEEKSNETQQKLPVKAVPKKPVKEEEKLSTRERLLKKIRKKRV